MAELADAVDNRDKSVKRLFAEKFADLANIAAGSLIFGQFIYPQRFSVKLAICGLIVVMSLYTLSFLLHVERKVMK